MSATFKDLTNYLVRLGIDDVPHSGKSFLAHLIGVCKLMESVGCDAELCRAGIFHSIYGTELFQGFKLPLDRRAEVRDLIGARAERLGYLNSAMDREAFDAAVERGQPPFRFRDRFTGEETELPADEFDDLCRVHLYDWLEQVPRSRHGWGYRRAAYRRLAERLGGVAVETYDRVFSQEPAGQSLGG
jgi:hypothetical protein